MKTTLGFLLLMLIIWSLSTWDFYLAIRPKPLTLNSPEIYAARYKMGREKKYELVGDKLYVWVDGKRLRLRY